jgi:hypothetical protein
MKQETTQLKFFTEYYQFYVQDAETKATTDAPDFWNDEAGKNKIAYGIGLLGITVAKYAEIKVEVCICESAPELDAKADHIVDAPLPLPSGKLQILCCTNFDIQCEKILEMCNYIVRASSYNLASVKQDEGDDFYKIEIWKADLDVVTIQKEYIPIIVSE